MYKGFKRSIDEKKEQAALDRIPGDLVKAISEKKREGGLSWPLKISAVLFWLGCKAYGARGEKAAEAMGVSIRAIERWHKDFSDKLRQRW